MAGRVRQRFADRVLSFVGIRTNGLPDGTLLSMYEVGHAHGLSLFIDIKNDSVRFKDKLTKLFFEVFQFPSQGTTFGKGFETVDTRVKILQPEFRIVWGTFVDIAEG